MKAMLIMAGTMACASLGTAGMAGYQWLAQEQEVTTSKQCETHAMQSVQSALRTYAAKHDEVLPQQSQFRPWAVSEFGQSWQIAEGCEEGPYQWAKGIKRVHEEAHSPVVWCAQPHGYSAKWRNVIFDDLSIRKVPEADFEAWLNKVGPLDPDHYDRAG